MKDFMLLSGFLGGCIGASIAILYLVSSFGNKTILDIFSIIMIPISLVFGFINLWMYVKKNSGGEHE